MGAGGVRWGRRRVGGAELAQAAKRVQRLGRWLNGLGEAWMVAWGPCARAALTAGMEMRQIGAARPSGGGLGGDPGGETGKGGQMGEGGIHTSCIEISIEEPALLEIALITPW